MTKTKKIIFPGATLLISLYVSVLFLIGLVLGYIGTKLFYEKFVEKGKVKLVFLDIKKWQFHFHHWIMGGLTFGLFLIVGHFYRLPGPKFFWGIAAGLMAHDFYIDKKWYKVFYRKNK